MGQTTGKTVKGGLGMETPWSSTKLPRYPRLEEQLYADAAVIGGGIAGILTAYFLHEQGVRVILLEEDRLAGGTTARTTAKITAQHGVFCEQLVQNFGVHLARQYVQANLHAVKQYRDLIERKGIACDFSAAPSYVYAAPDGPPLEREMAYAAYLGAPARLCVPTELPFPVREAVCFEQQARFDPLKFLAALLPGLTIYEHSPARDIRGHTVRCDGGSVTADHIIVTTHFPMLDRRGLYSLRMYQQRSYLLALANAPKLEGMYLDAGSDGWSLRQSGELLLLGGGSHRCGENLGDSYECLRRQAGLWFPQSREICAWSTQDCMTLDGVPYVGLYSSTMPFLHVATGFGKWGMTNAMAAATILTAGILGNHSPYAEVYSPTRFFPSASISTLMEGAGYAIRGIGRRLFVPGEKAAENIAPGHGGIVQYHGKKYGVYRHTDGSLYAVSPACPHLGCELAWNDDEKTWDCPCHGSRFDYTGRRLHEPAKVALKPCKDFGRREI